VGSPGIRQRPRRGGPAGAGCGTAESSKVNGSIRASSASKAAQGSTLTSAQKRVLCTLVCGTAGAEHPCDGELSGSGRNAAMCEAATGVEGHSNRRPGKLIRSFAASKSCCRSRRRCESCWRSRQWTFARASAPWPSCAGPSSMSIHFRAVFVFRSRR